MKRLLLLSTLALSQVGLSAEPQRPEQRKDQNGTLLMTTGAAVTTGSMFGTIYTGNRLSEQQNERELFNENTTRAHEAFDTRISRLRRDLNNQNIRVQESTQHRIDGYYEYHFDQRGRINTSEFPPNSQSVAVDPTRDTIIFSIRTEENFDVIKKEVNAQIVKFETFRRQFAHSPDLSRIDNHLKRLKAMKEALDKFDQRSSAGYLQIENLKYPRKVEVKIPLEELKSNASVRDMSSLLEGLYAKDLADKLVRAEPQILRYATGWRRTLPGRLETDAYNRTRETLRQAEADERLFVAENAEQLSKLNAEAASYGRAKMAFKGGVFFGASAVGYGAYRALTSPSSETPVGVDQD